MKAILEFNLPEDQSDFGFAKDGHKYFKCLVELSQELRNKDKYSEEQETSWGEVRRLFLATLADNGVDLDYLA